MALPPVPDGLRAPVAEDFVPAPARRARLRLLALTVVLGLGSYLAVRRWGGDLVAMTGAAGALIGWLAGIVAQRICLRRDVPVALELAEATVEETERGRLAFWHFAPPVPERLSRLEVEADAALVAEPGDAVAARVQETGYGTIELKLGSLGADGWTLPAPQPAWPAAAQVYASVAILAVLVVLVLAASPSQTVAAQIVAAQQEPWETGTGAVPWRVTVQPVGDQRQLALTLSHPMFLELLEPGGQRALAAPGLLPAMEREALKARYLPLGKTVELRRTWLGPLQTLYYVGPER